LQLAITTSTRKDVAALALAIVFTATVLVAQIIMEAATLKPARRRLLAAPGKRVERPRPVERTRQCDNSRINSCKVTDCRLNTKPMNIKQHRS